MYGDVCIGRGTCIMGDILYDNVMYVGTASGGLLVACKTSTVRSRELKSL